MGIPQSNVEGYLLSARGETAARTVTGRQVPQHQEDKSFQDRAAFCRRQQVRIASNAFKNCRESSFPGGRWKSGCQKAVRTDLP